jgi:Zn-dependent protease with chaperone function
VMRSERSTAISAWGLAARPNRGVHFRLAALWAALLLVPSLAAALWLSWWVGLAVAVLAVLVVTAGPFVQLRRLERRFAGVVAVAGSEPRLENLVGGLSDDHRLVTPRVIVLENAPPNAFVWRPLFGTAVLAISRSYLEALSRTELEGVIAHCLVRIDTSDARAATMAGLIGPLGARVAPKVGILGDVGAASLTRYPPGLASAIRKAVPARGSAPLWFVSDAPSHRAAATRVQELADL